MTFPAKAPDEVKLITFDFSTEAAEGTTLNVPTMTVVMKTDSGAITDLTVGTLVVTDALDANGDVVAGHEGHWIQTLVGGGVDGAKYWLQCEVNASNGEHHRIDKILPVKEAAALVQ